MLDSIRPRKPHNKKVNNKTRTNKKKPGSKSWFRFKIVALFAVLLLLGIFVGSRVVTFADKIVDDREGNFFSQLFIAGDNKLIGEQQGEIRILLLGIGGEGHDGGTLTDTIILATLKVPQNKNDELKASLISIPRDFAVFIPGRDYRKINSAYAYGEIGDQTRDLKCQ